MKMPQELLPEIRRKIDQIIRPGLTLIELHESLLLLKVEDIEDRGDRLTWTIDGREVKETELGNTYTRAALIKRGLVVEDDDNSGSDSALSLSEVPNVKEPVWKAIERDLAIAKD